MTSESARSQARKDMDKAAKDSEQSKDRERHKQEVLNTMIEEQVIHALGEPVNLLKVQVRPLWEGHYRVNVYSGVDSVCAWIIHSYFVMADKDGSILESTPKIKKLY